LGRSFGSFRRKKRKKRKNCDLEPTVSRRLFKLGGEGCALKEKNKYTRSFKDRWKLFLRLTGSRRAQLKVGQQCKPSGAFEMKKAKGRKGRLSRLLGPFSLGGYGHTSKECQRRGGERERKINIAIGGAEDQGRKDRSKRGSKKAGKLH